MRANEFVSEEKTRLDPKCWTGKKIGNPKTKVKGGVRVNNCVPAESVEEDLSRRGFLKGMGAAAVAGAAGNSSAITYDPKTNTTNFDVDDIIIINKFLELYWLIRNDLPLPPDKKNSLIQEYQMIANKFTRQATNGGPFLNSQWSTVNRTMSSRKENNPAEHEKFRAQLVANAKKIVSDFEGLMEFRESVEQGLSEEFDLIESIIEGIAEHNGVDAEVVWADLESLTEDELYAFAVTSQLNEDWQKANKRDKTDGMSQKAVNAYRREHPGSKLKTAVTTKPGKLKKGGKASKRRKSYCSRSRGQMKMHNISCAKTPDKAICKARRRWNC
jgi:hypothetical protein